MLTFATEDMNTTAQQAVFFDAAFANVALRADIDALMDFGVSVRKQGGEANQAVCMTKRHGEAEEVFSEKVTGLSGQQA